MKYGRHDYDHTQDPVLSIPEEEPVFLLRAQDKHAARVVRFYADCVAEDQGDTGIVRGAFEQADLMDAWPVNKAPDL